jgi:hypothetical protein
VRSGELLSFPLTLLTEFFNFQALLDRVSFGVKLYFCIWNSHAFGAFGASHVKDGQVLLLFPWVYVTCFFSFVSSSVLLYSAKLGCADDVEKIIWKLLSTAFALVWQKVARVEMV